MDRQEKINRQLCLDLSFPIKYKFANFYGSDDVVLAIKSAIYQKSRNRFIFLHGNSATGKTHLMQAASQDLIEVGSRVIYLDLNNSSALDPAIIDGLWDLDLVCIDNIDSIFGNEFWEESIFNMFNQLASYKKPLIISSKYAPLDVGFKLPDLITRLCSGLIFKLPQLSDEQKVIIMKNRARDSGFYLPTPVAHNILNNYPRDLKSLFAVVDALIGLSASVNKKLTISMLNQLENK